MENIKQDMSYDNADERDYNYNELFWEGDKSLPATWVINDDKYQTQWAESITSHMCVFYSASHGSNIQNFYEWSKSRVAGKVLWLIALERKLLDPKRGAAIQSGPALLKSEWHIDGWAKVHTIEDIKDSLFNYRPVLVGSNNINRSETRKAPFVAIPKSSYGHAFVIIGYDDIERQLICKNSYWTEKYDGWLFYISYENYTSILFPSKYSIIDSKDEIIAYNKKIMEWINIEKAKEAFEKGLWNGKDATGTASREEVATMILRGLEKLRDGEL